MAKFRLKSAHALRHAAFDTHVWLPGDKENEHLGEEKGTLVGDGTPYPVASATIDMEPLDEDAQKMIDSEYDRLATNSYKANLSPVDQIPVHMQDDFEQRYIEPGVPRPQKKSA